jgi:2-phospho-L-lactate guanylyltransferase
MREYFRVGSADWVVVVPVKRLAEAKSRLRGGLPAVPHEDLVLALVLDTVVAALASPDVAELLIVTDDPLVAAASAGLGAKIVPDLPGAGLNAAFAHGAEAAAGRPVAALAGDLPALRPGELSAALRAAADLGAHPGSAARAGTGRRRAPAGQHRGSAAGAGVGRRRAPASQFRGFVPDAPGTGTTLLTALPGVHLDPHFGVDSAEAHRRSGAVELLGPWPSLRRDVDLPADLAEAARLGLGRHTAAL